MTTVTLLVTASRSWTDSDAIHGVLAAQLGVHGGMFLMHGACPTGGDDIADKWALAQRECGAAVAIERHPADWDRFGKSAGFKRNADMVNRLALIRDAGLPVLVCAFILNESKGATHTLRLADVAVLPTRVFRNTIPTHPGKAHRSDGRAAT